MLIIRHTCAIIISFYHRPIIPRSARRDDLNISPDIQGTTIPLEVNRELRAEADYKRYVLEYQLREISDDYCGVIARCVGRIAAVLSAAFYPRTTSIMARIAARL